MKPRVQSSILLLVTLFIGILLGALLQSSLQKNRIRHLGFLRSEEGFVNHMVMVIEPTSEEQEVAVIRILSEESPKITSAFKKHRDLIRSQFNNLEDQLIPLLDDAQKERVRRRFNPPRRPENRDKNTAD
jgi:hypothetical protein